MLRLHDEVEVVVLDREVDDAKGAALRVAKGGHDAREDVGRAKRANACDDAPGQVDRNGRRVLRTRDVRHHRARSASLAPGACAPTTPAARSLQGELLLPLRSGHLE